MERNFKFRGKMFFLTYPKCDLDCKYMLEALTQKFLTEGGKVTKYIVAKEKHADGSDHRHCYIQLENEFKHALRASFLDIEGNHPNIEHVRSGKAVMKYCTKEGDYITNLKLNEVKKPRKEIAKEILFEGKTLESAVVENPGLIWGYQRLKGDIACFRADQKKAEALDRTCGLWISGPSGCGKTTIAFTKFGNYYLKDRTKWWDQYGGEETIIADDVDDSWKDVFTYFKWWADKWPFKAEYKGGMFTLRPKKFIVTSNRTLDELLDLWKWPEDDREPYRRRFNIYWITSIEDWENQL